LSIVKKRGTPGTPLAQGPVSIVRITKIKEAQKAKSRKNSMHKTLSQTLCGN
jgi:hypothetical protein